MDAITYLITFCYNWTNPELAGASFNPPKAGTKSWTTWATTSYKSAIAQAAEIMAGEMDDPCGYVTAIHVDRHEYHATGMKRSVVRARRDRVVACGCGEHHVADRNGEWTTGAGSVFSTDICTAMQAAA